MVVRMPDDTPRAARTRLRDVMNPFVETIRPRATVQEAAVRMRAFRVGFLPVQSAGELHGVITDRDILLRTVAVRRDPLRTSVEETMTRDIICCWPEQNVEDAVRLMGSTRVRRLLIVSLEGRLVGVLGLGDLVQHGFVSEATSIFHSTVLPYPAFAGFT
jgi:CBS domain-containing protein